MNLILFKCDLNLILFERLNRQGWIWCCLNMIWFDFEWDVVWIWCCLAGTGICSRTCATRKTSATSWWRPWTPSNTSSNRLRSFSFKAHRLLYHSTLGLRVIKKKKKLRSFSSCALLAGLLLSYSQWIPEVLKVASSSRPWIPSNTSSNRLRSFSF